MGIFLTLLYIGMAYLAPATIIGDAFAQNHVQVYIAIMTMAVSLFNASESRLLRLPQTYAILALPLAITISLSLAGVTRQVPASLTEFLSNALVFFFVAANFRTRTHLKLLIVMLLLVCAFVIDRGQEAINTMDPNNPYVLFMRIGDSGTEFITRIRGLGFLNDPNDLAQVLVGLIPLTFIFWRKGNVFNNVALVMLPVLGLLYGMFLTHSRGGMVALLAMIVFMGRRKVGVLPSILLGGVLFIGLSAAGWTGGRDVSASTGEDRMGAWSEGLTLLRSHPIFGVGYNRFAENYEITAHNTVVVCATELGLFGFFLWTVLIVSTLRGVSLGAQPSLETGKEENEEKNGFLNAGRMSPAGPAPARLAEVPVLSAAVASGPRDRAFFRERQLRHRKESPAALSAPVVTPGVGFQVDPQRFLAAHTWGQLSDVEIRRLCSLVIGSLVSFFAAGWFLSRSYAMPLFLNMGIATVVYRMALERNLAPPPLTFRQTAKYAAMTCGALLIVIYMIVRLDHLLPK